MALSSSDHCTELYPIPFATLVARLLRECDAGQEIYGLRRKEWWTPDPARDLTFRHVGREAANPLGPASGPHTQLAQNLVMAFLGGGRFMELKTVQVRDDLVIPRPCIAVPHVGYNVEWSQELRIRQSAVEYAKGWMLVHLLARRLPQLGGARCIFDLSLGYDLAGIRGEAMSGFIAAMKDAGPLIRELLDVLPAATREAFDFDVPAQLSGSTTLSTFHGCPADEIEAIATHTMRHHGLHTVIKLNPTLLGFERCRQLLHEGLGYRHIAVTPEPFEKDLQWAQLLDMVPRLRRVAAEVGVEVGFKLTNTLVMQSPEPPFAPGEMYLSGAPLHVLAMTLAAELREAIGDDVPLSFSAGIDASNFPGCVEAGLGPVTTCTDLLKAKGYGRLPRYLRNLEARMAEVGARNLDDLSSASALGELARATREHPRYRSPNNATPPKKVGSHLVLFDCLTCDICIPVCPNGANFSFPVAPGEHQPGRVRWADGTLVVEPGERLVVAKRHQIGCTADACNLCGECDIWCPEDGGPYLVKPNLFLSALSFEEHPERDGFLLDNDREGLTWRRAGERLVYREREGEAELVVEGGRLTLRDDVPVRAEGSGELDLTLAVSMRLILEGLRTGAAGTWLPAVIGSC